MRTAQVHEATGFVANVVEWDEALAPPGWVPPAGYIMVPDPDGQAGPGYTWDGSAFVPPPPPIAPGGEQQQP